MYNTKPFEKNKNIRDIVSKLIKGDILEIIVFYDGESDLRLYQNRPINYPPLLDFNPLLPLLGRFEDVYTPRDQENKIYFSISTSQNNGGMLLDADSIKGMTIYNKRKAYRACC